MKNLNKYLILVMMVVMVADGTAVDAGRRADDERNRVGLGHGPRIRQHG